MSSDLLTIDEIIRRLSSNKVHFFYLSKLGLIPKAIRQKVRGAMTGCYPQEVVSRVATIEKMKSGGLSYAKIRNYFSAELVVPSSTGAMVVAASLGWYPFLTLLIGLLFGYIVGTSFNGGRQDAFREESLGLASRYILGAKAEQLGEQVYVITIPDSFSRVGKTDIKILND